MKIYVSADIEGSTTVAWRDGSIVKKGQPGMCGGWYGSGIMPARLKG
jgi:hypothetical protein